MPNNDAHFIETVFANCPDKERLLLRKFMRIAEKHDISIHEAYHIWDESFVEVT